MRQMVRSISDVFPTRVGVFLDTIATVVNQARLPHACGGVSPIAGIEHLKEPSSPRVWGCFLVKSQKEMQGRVFPTRVGVFLLP